MNAQPSFKAHFSRSLAGGGGRLHLAAHSHHLWPDVSFDAHMQAWQDAATLWDAKWPHVLADVLPEAQRHVARHLGLPDPATIAFAPNTHEFVVRLFSAMPAGRAARVLTTDAEFHSFSRQAQRLHEDGSVELEIVAAEPFDTFPQRFMAAAAHPHDLVFFSHVFYNSGFVVPDIDAVVAAVADAATLVVIDGYHAFMAMPVDLSRIHQRAFYMGGGYKYAAAGEGACFLACPAGVVPRPRNTGWYAAFGALSEAASGGPGYPTDGGRFMGASFDPSGLYRLNAVMRWLDRLSINTAESHARVRAIQKAFVVAMDEAGLPGLSSAKMIVPAGSSDRGNFLAYRSADAAAYQKALEAAGIVTDVRADVLRVGFGIYHDLEDVPGIAARIIAAMA